MPEAKKYLIKESTHTCDVCKKQKSTLCILEVDNLFRKNMMNIKEEYKLNLCNGLYDSNWDSYCSLVAWDDFLENYQMYIDIAEQKREELYKYDLKKELK